MTGIARKRFDPDYLCFLRFVLNVLHYVHEAHPDAEKVEFVIERNGPITKHIQRFHESIPKGLLDLGRPDLAALVGDLIPGGKERVPLQAADLLCWYSRNFDRLPPKGGRFIARLKVATRLMPTAALRPAFGNLGVVTSLLRSATMKSDLLKADRLKGGGIRPGTTS